MAYLLDANVFIEAKQRYYGLDFCPAFWDWLDAANLAGTVFSIEKVGDELAAIADELSAWATARGPRFFLPLAPPMLAELRAVSSWAGGQGYDQGAVMTFLQVADSYLVAQALALVGMTLGPGPTPERGVMRRNPAFVATPDRIRSRSGTLETIKEVARGTAAHRQAGAIHQVHEPGREQRGGLPRRRDQPQDRDEVAPRQERPADRRPGAAIPVDRPGGAAAARRLEPLPFGGRAG